MSVDSPFGPPSGPPTDLPAPFRPTLPPARSTSPTLPSMPTSAPRTGPAPLPVQSRPTFVPPPAGATHVHRGTRQRRVKQALWMRLVWSLGLLASVTFVYLGRHVGATPSYPKAWDSRVQPLIDFVQRERGLTFEHPIRVDFLSEADYVALFTDPAQAPSASQRDGAEKLSGVLDAAGLAKNYDALAGDATVRSVGTLGFYSFDHDRIVVRGDVLTPAVRVVLAHELTHALQSQHFTIHLGGPDDFRLRSVVEADAMRVEEAYRKTMSAADQAAARAGTIRTPEVDRSLSSVPKVVVDSTDAPYALGPELLRTVYKERGNAGVDALLTAPPSERELIEPWSYSTPTTDETVAVTAPAGAVVFESPRAMSMLDTLLMLDAWLPWTAARGALDHWKGGGYVSYQKGGKSGPVCFTETARFDGDATAFVDAVTAWAKAAKTTANPTTNGADVSFEACQRSATAVAPPHQVVDTLDAIIFEGVVISSSKMPRDPHSLSLQRCYARHMVDDRTIGPLLMKVSWTATDRAAYQRVRTARAHECGLVVGKADPSA